MEENRDKIDNEMNKNEETKENEQKINNDCNCGCEHCGPDGCSEEDCKECDKECDCKSESNAGENACEDSTVGANAGSVGANARGAHEKDELALANEKIKDWEDKYKRLLAEFDNFRKRSEKESAMMIDIGASMVLTKILPIVDNFERAINSIPDDLKDNSFVDGVDKIYKQMLKTFEELGVKPIEAVGKPFDANLHNAVMTDENAEGEVDTVVEELQKGYTYKDQVLRHSMVKVKK
ncbi:MAG: nucleotide exchange factor GrpE [Lachnospiraceae bacterium]|nr:nucleotide exchange factor GrpE [Lachnospiraceae bacterium]